MRTKEIKFSDYFFFEEIAATSQASTVLIKQLHKFDAQ